MCELLTNNIMYLLMSTYFFLPNLIPIIPNLDPFDTEEEGGTDAGAGRVGAGAGATGTGGGAMGCVAAGSFRSGSTSRTISECGWEESVVVFGVGVGVGSLTEAIASSSFIVASSFFVLPSAPVFTSFDSSLVVSLLALLSTIFVAWPSLGRSNTGASPGSLPMPKKGWLNTSRIDCNRKFGFGCKSCCQRRLK